MKRIEMIKEKKDFSRIINNKKYHGNKYFVIYEIEEINNYPHFGIAISKKYGKAFERNKIKRQVRNIVDKYKKLFKNNHNYIIMIKKSCYDQSYQQLDHEFQKLIKEI